MNVSYREPRNTYRNWQNFSNNLGWNSRAGELQLVPYSTPYSQDLVIVDRKKRPRPNFKNKNKGRPAPKPVPVAPPRIIYRPKYKEDEEEKTKMPKYSNGYHRRVKGGRKVRKQDPYKVSIKLERGFEVDAWNCAYAGGWTHPMSYTLTVLSQSILRFIAVRARIDFGHFSEVMYAPGATGQNFSFVYYYRQSSPTVTALTRVAVASTGVATWGAFADLIANSFVATFGEGPAAAGPPASASPQRNIVYVGLEGASATPIVASQFYKAEELFIEVKGESHIQVQNRSTSETSGSESTENVRSNPLRGKYYQFKRGRPMIASPGNMNSTTDYHIFRADLYSGAIDAFDKAGASTVLFPASVANAISKPVIGNFFSNCTKTKYCTANPGEIVRSSVQKTYNFSLSKWMSVFREKMLQAGTKTLANLITFEDPVTYRLGVSHCYGFEKMCDTTTATGNEIKLGLEHNLFLAARVYHRPKSGCVATVVL